MEAAIADKKVTYDFARGCLQLRPCGGRCFTYNEET